MDALVYEGFHKRSYKNVRCWPGRSPDAIVRVTYTIICGTGLDILKGQTERAERRRELRKRERETPYFGEILFYELLQFEVTRFSEVRLHPLKSESDLH